MLDLLLLMVTFKNDYHWWATFLNCKLIGKIVKINIYMHAYVHTV